MVGDEVENDIRPANKEGISTVFIGPRNCEESDYWIQNILQLMDILGGNNDKGN